MRRTSIMKESIYKAVSSNHLAWCIINSTSIHRHRRRQSASETLLQWLPKTNVVDRCTHAWYKLIPLHARWKGYDLWHRPALGSNQIGQLPTGKRLWPQIRGPSSPQQYASWIGRHSRLELDSLLSWLWRIEVHCSNMRWTTLKTENRRGFLSFDQSLLA